MPISDPNVLIVEDIGSIAMVYQTWLKKDGIDSKHVTTGEEALKLLRTDKFRAVLLDLELPDINGLEILKTIEEEQIGVTVVVITSSGSISTAVTAMRHGAYDFVVKPAAEPRLLTTVRNALERVVLQKAVKQIKSDFAKTGNHGFIGSSLQMVAVYKTIDAISKSSASVFITGESGTGKEVCAIAIHNAGPRKANKFVALNCAAIPKDLIESEIFGHVKGAFSGATGDREGAASTANGGTLFLDEICEMDLNLQSKLLRFLQTGSVQRVGSDKLQKVNVRILCATNRDPMTEVSEGRFREDLFYRLHVVPIHLPALREREGDVVEIAKLFVKQANEEEGKSFSGFTEAAQDLLLQHTWPGNVRELQNVIRNAVILNDGEIIEAHMLNISSVSAQSTQVPTQTSPQARSLELPVTLDISQPYASIERQLIEAAIDAHNGSIPKAAEMLDISPSTIYRKKEAWE